MLFITGSRRNLSDVKPPEPANIFFRNSSLFDKKLHPICQTASYTSQQIECNFVESKENFPALFVCSNAQEIESAEEFLFPLTLYRSMNFQLRSNGFGAILCLSNMRVLLNQHRNFCLQLVTRPRVPVYPRGQIVILRFKQQLLFFAWWFS